MTTTHHFRNEAAITDLREQIAALVHALDATTFDVRQYGVDLHELDVLLQLIDLRARLFAWLQLAGEVRTVREVDTITDEGKSKSMRARRTMGTPVDSPTAATD